MSTIVTGSTCKMLFGSVNLFWLAILIFVSPTMTTQAVLAGLAQIAHWPIASPPLSEMTLQRTSRSFKKSCSGFGPQHTA